MFIFRGGAVVDATMTTDERRAQVARWAAWTRDLQARGHHVPGGCPLATSGARVTGPNRTVTNGAQVDHELVTGTYLVEADDLAAASELATSCPILDVGGSIEIRPRLERPE